MWLRFFVGLSLAINCVLVYSLIWGSQGLKAYRNLKGQHETLKERLVALDEKNIALSREIRLLQTDEKYQEKIIRKRFNFVKDNEILYIFPGTRAASKAGADSHEAKN